MKGRYHSLLWTMALSCGLAASGVASAATGPATGDTSNMGIALSNSYAGNTWRQQMMKVWQNAADSAMKQHLIAKTKIVNADNSAPQQASQIENSDPGRVEGDCHQRGLADSIERGNRRRLQAGHHGRRVRLPGDRAVRL